MPKSFALLASLKTVKDKVREAGYWPIYRSRVCCPPPKTLNFNILKEIDRRVQRKKGERWYVLRSRLSANLLPHRWGVASLCLNFNLKTLKKGQCKGEEE